MFHLFWFSPDEQRHLYQFEILFIFFTWCKWKNNCLKELLSTFPWKAWKLILPTINLWVSWTNSQNMSEASSFQHKRVLLHGSEE
jgi:hypothetical protein